jgi:DNA-directed RNA polymerase specialized sigma subunit
LTRKIGSNGLARKAVAVGRKFSEKSGLQLTTISRKAVKNTYFFRDLEAGTKDFTEATITQFINFCRANMNQKRKSKLTEKDKELMMLAYCRRMPLTEIAQRFGVCKSAITKVARRSGIASPFK